MRLKIVVLVLLAACVPAGLMLWFNHPGAPAETPPAPVPVVTSATASPPATPLSAPTQAAANASGPALQPGLAPTDEAVRIQQINAKQAEIDRLVERGDAGALEAILDFLNHSEPEVRQAALDAITRLDNRAAIPRLREAAERATDADEKKALLDAADYLALPSTAEAPRGNRSPTPPPRKR